MVSIYTFVYLLSESILKQMTTTSNLPTGTIDPAEEQEMKTCPHCLGDGCETCDGNGKLTKQEYELYKYLD